MKRLLFVSPVGSKFGGAPNSLFHLLRDIRTDYETTVVMPELGGLSSALKDIGVAFYDFTFRYRNLLSLVRLIKEGQYNLVYGNGYHYRCFIALIAAKVARKPFIWHIRETLDEDSKGKQVNWADVILANSHSVADVLRNYTRKEILVIPNGVVLEEFNGNRNFARQFLRDELELQRDSIIFINVGTLCYRKNQMHAVEIASGVVNQHPEAHFVFAGNFQEMDYLQQLKDKALNLGIQSNTHFVGHKENINQYVVGSDILLHTARKEPQGRVILEAMASKIPVVAYDVGGIKEALIQNKTGFLFPFGSIEPVVDALNMLIQNSEMRKTMGLHGFTYVQQFSSVKTSQKIVSVIEKTIREKQ